MSRVFERTSITSDERMLKAATSTITDTNYFDDPSSYRAFLARIYAGLAVSGQRGPAGDADIDSTAGDLGATGGVDADPALWQDADADGVVALWVLLKYRFVE